MKTEAKFYEAHHADVVDFDMQANVLMASVTPAPDSGIMGNGLQFTEQDGQW